MNLDRFEKKLDDFRVAYWALPARHHIRHVTALITVLCVTATVAPLLSPTVLNGSMWMFMAVCASSTVLIGWWLLELSVAGSESYDVYAHKWTDHLRCCRSQRALRWAGTHVSYHGFVYAVAQNPYTPPDVLAAISKKHGSVAARHAARNPSCSDEEAYRVCVQAVEQYNSNENTNFLSSVAITEIALGRDVTERHWFDLFMTVEDGYVLSRLLVLPAFPPDLLEQLAFHPSKEVRVAVRDHPNTSVRARTLAAL